ncbi:glycine cleavage system protein GcvH [Candidatus Puniceispirillum sp.]|nr:glycine cleavage system protein GcvH [Candidatus Puniceispirillum sp.]MDC3234656.1 glycine cleavage system protein GcvH [Candidatus Puniceispirillum sp.]
MLKFSEDHEWARLDNDICSVGISPHALEQLGDIVFVELPEIGTKIDKGDAVAVFESVKAASDIYSPAAGMITEVNSALLDDLTSIMPDSAMENWLFKLEINDASDLDVLMDEDAYNALIG